MARTEFHLEGAHRYDLRSPVAWLRSHLLRYAWLLGLFLITTAGMAVAMNLGALAVGRAFDTVAADVAPGVVVTAALLVAAAYLGYGGCDIVNSLALRVLGLRVERDAREELYLSLLGKSPAFHGRQRVGDLMARATNDISQVGLMLAPNAGLVIESLLALIVPYVTIALVFPADLLLVPAIFLLALLVTLSRYSRRLQPIAEAQRAQFGRLNARLAEAVGGIEVVQGFAQERAEAARFRHEARAFRDLFVREGSVQARYTPLLVYGLTIGAAFGHALIVYLQGRLTVGQVIAYMGLVETLRTPIYFSLMTFAQIQLGLASAERVLELITAPDPQGSDHGGHGGALRGEIVFAGVGFSYRGQGDTYGRLARRPNRGDGDAGSQSIPEPHPAALRDLTFTIRPGETVAIVGQTGAGKTTLTKLVNRTLDATAGQVLIDGVDVREWSLDSLRSQIGAIEQDIFLFSRSIADNIAFGARGQATRAQIEAAARQAQAHDFISELPEGYDTVIGERGVTLSGGQRQRIAIARAFLSDPRILIIDDSTSALDSATEDQIQRAIHAILAGRTTLLITHRITQIRNADRILLLKNGSLVAQGTHDELLERSEQYRQLFVTTKVV